ncbi:MAG TPA: helix-turn-helix transcriptional regulator [Caulobacter sp.]|nr:helix-turn-helix transcriptional regulator [Caulobacter sp.]
MRAVADELREARVAAGCSQRELARRLGKAHSHVSKIEAGARRIDTLEFILVAKALGIDPGELTNRAVRRLQANASA